MTERDEPSAWQPDPGDAVNPDLTTSVGGEDVDEDRLGLDPLEEGMDPPEDWVGADQFGISAEEQREGETLDQRLAQEVDDVTVDPDREAADEAGGSVAEGWRTPPPAT
jgi:hypothetical protein